MQGKRILVVIAGAILLLFGVPRAYEQVVFRFYLRPYQRIMVNTPPEMVRAAGKQIRRLARVWQTRQGREPAAVAADITPYLADPGGAHLLAARALGRLAEPSGAAPLAARLKRGEFAPGERLVTKMALARIRNRDRHGWARVDAVCRSVGLSGAGVWRLARRLYPSGSRYVGGCPAAVIVDEVVDLLYTMRKEGENTEPFARALAVVPVQAAKLHAAALPEKEELAYLVEWLSRPSVRQGEGLPLAEFLAEKGAPAVPVITARLEQLHRERIRSNHPRVGNLFYALGQIDTPETHAVVERYLRDPLFSAEAHFTYHQLHGPREPSRHPGREPHPPRITGESAG